MTIYIGEIPIHYVSSFDTDHSLKGIEEIHFLGIDSIPYLAEQASNIRNFGMTGTLLQDSGVISTIDNMAEDILALKSRRSQFNYIHDFQNRSGWLGIKEAGSDKNASSLVTRPYSMSGKFLPKALYQTRMHSHPIIRTNDFSFSLGVDDCDNYIAIPIGATYTGGDGSTITRTGKDGTITLVLATSDNDIKWDVGEADIENGECKVYDDDGWLQVYSRDHEFEGNVVIENSLYRVTFDPATEYIAFYYWATGTSAYVKIDDFTAGTFTRVTIVENNPDIIRVKLDSEIEVEIRRGHPPSIETGTTDLIAISLTPADQSTTTENYLILGTSLYICSDESFSLVNSSKNCDDGKKWIFYETVSATAEDIAHQAMVNARQTRELIQR